MGHKEVGSRVVKEYFKKVFDGIVGFFLSLGYF